MGRHLGDFPLEKLRDYRPALENKPRDFEAFWSEQKNDLKNERTKVETELREYPVPSVEVLDIVFTSWDGTPLNGMLVKPKSMAECPVIICFPGYTGSCGLPVDYLKWVSVGFAVYVFDVRGQGSSPDFGNYQNGSRIPGWMLLGIHQPENYYFTNIYRDILMQLKWIRSQDSPIIPTKLGVMGSSQGGGLALSAAGLDGEMDFVMADWPFLAHFERALDVALSGPYMEIVNYFKWNDPQYSTFDQVIRTLGYIDSVHFCESITCQTLMAAGLEDAITPPSTVFAAYNHIQSANKNIEVYPQFTHELNPFHDEKKLEFLSRQLENNPHDTSGIGKQQLFDL
ncbi:acetylxylan esterase [Virgibacillus sp. L01]|uniref:acetylxylan esterase n=1 Tax=Virgibacillus sp. L01 TaxID=3457429 RepID=UPI003FD0A59D